MDSHQRAAVVDKVQRGFEFQRPGSNQCGVFTQTVSGGRFSQNRSGQEFLEYSQAGNRVSQECRLRIAGEVDVFLWVFEGQRRHVIAEDL